MLPTFDYCEPHLIAEWYVEIMNSYLVLEFNKDGEPEQLLFKTMLPFHTIDMTKQRYKQSEAS